MNPLKRIYSEHGPLVRKLAGSLAATPAQRSELQQAAAETEALLELGLVIIPPPSRERMLLAAYEQAGQLVMDEEDRKMNPFYALFSGKRWISKLAIGLALGLVVLACLTVTLVPRPQGGGFKLEPAQPVLAAQPGYLLAASTSAEDEEQAQAAAAQLENVARQVIALKQEELEKFQAILDELSVELDAKQALIAQQLAGQELSGEDQAKLAELEAKLADKAALLAEKSVKLQELAGLLSSKEQLVREQTAVLRNSLDGLGAAGREEINSVVEQDGKGNYRIKLALPGVSPEVAAELKRKLAELPELKDIEMDGVSFILKDGTACGASALGEIDGCVVSPNCSIVKIIKSQVADDGTQVDMEEVDGRIIVKIKNADGENLRLEGKDAANAGGYFTVTSQQEGGGLDVEELGQLYQVIVSDDARLQELYELGYIAGEMTEEQLKELAEQGCISSEQPEGAYFENTGAMLYKGELDEARLQDLREQGYLAPEMTPEKLKELEAQGYIVQGEFQIMGAHQVPDARGLEQFKQGRIVLEDGLAQIEGLSEGTAWAIPGQSTLSVIVGDTAAEEGGSGEVRFGWFTGEELGSYVFTGEPDDEVQIVQIGDTFVCKGDLTAFEPELAEIRAYLEEHYPGQDAGFKASGQAGALAVKVLLDGQVVETLQAARDASGGVVITAEG